MNLFSHPRRVPGQAQLFLPLQSHALHFTHQIDFIFSSDDHTLVTTLPTPSQYLHLRMPPQISPLPHPLSDQFLPGPAKSLLPYQPPSAPVFTPPCAHISLLLPLAPLSPSSPLTSPRLPPSLATTPPPTEAAARGPERVSPAVPRPAPTTPFPPRRALRPVSSSSSAEASLLLCPAARALPPVPVVGRAGGWREEGAGA